MEVCLSVQHKVLKRSSPIKSGGSEAEVVSDGGQDRQDSGDSVKIQMEAAREQHRRRLAKKGNFILILCLFLLCDRRKYNEKSNLFY